jgi:hypothetical protein
MGRTDEIRWANDLVEELFLFAKLVKGEKINSSNTSKSALTSPD